MKSGIDGNRVHVHHVGTSAGGIAGAGDFTALLRFAVCCGCGGGALG